VAAEAGEEEEEEEEAGVAAEGERLPST